MSVSCSSSEDDYRSRRARSHSRKDVKGSKKRTRRRSHSPESREESKKRARRRSYSLESSAEPPRVRKRIGSKRKNGSEVGRKKTHKKNKPRREASVSSMSRASNSCETCWDRSTSSLESEFEKRRGRSERKDKEKKKLKKVKSGTKERRYRSRSHSSCSRSSEGNKYRDEEKKAGENNVKRLRSVITVLVEEKDDSVSNKDEHKEEIVYDNDDYPSCRSNDSNDGGHKRELDHQSNVASGKKVRVENEEGELVATELTESGREFEGRYIGSNPSSSGAGTNDFVKGKVAGVTGSVTGDDLESILRQRALENLRRFRGGLQTNANAPASKKDKSDGDMKQPTTAIADLVQIKIPKEDGAESVGATQELKEISVPALRRDSTCYLPDDYKTLDRKDGGHESGSAKQELACAPDQVALADEQNEKVSSAVGSVINRPKLATPALRHYSLKTHNPVKQTPASDELHQANLLLTESALVKHSAKTAQTMIPSSNYNEDLKDSCGSAASESSSCIKSKLAENGSNKPQGETAESSQFEQKTMTVMRGGEMVQVNISIYLRFCISFRGSNT
jgi:peptidyl-prolyl isomerase G (cyclophilin G)